MTGIIQERKNGWTAIVRNSKLFLVHSLDFPPKKAENAARFTTHRCPHEFVIEAHDIWAFLQTKGAPLHLAVPREDGQAMVRYSKIRYCNRVSCEQVFDVRLR